MLINPEAMVIITSNALPGERGWGRDDVGEEGNTKRSRVESPAASWKHRKDGCRKPRCDSSAQKFAKFAWSSVWKHDVAMATAGFRLGRD